MYSTAGVHPHHASEYDNAVHEHLRSLLQAPEVVSVGECGLDYFRDFSPRKDQRMAFDQQLDLAVESGLPVFLHQRDAHEDFMKVLAPRLQGISRAVAHCFTGSEDELRTYIDHDLYIGITGWICDERRGTHLREIVRLIPADRLMIETDAPYLLPRTLKPKPRSRRNEPQHLTEVLRIVAQSLDADPAEVGRQTTVNARRFFAIA
jgi:TatD DNase family protein